MIVMRMATTPSLNASRRWVCMRSGFWPTAPRRVRRWGMTPRAVAFRLVFRFLYRGTKRPHGVLVLGRHPDEVVHARPSLGRDRSRDLGRFGSVRLGAGIGARR